MQVLAHRGAWFEQFDDDGAPLVENTLAAFARAKTLGADGVEFDIHRTSDDQIVVHHDAVVPGFGTLADHPLSVIRAQCPGIPTLDAALDFCQGLRCNIEIKNLPLDADFDATHRIAVLLREVLERRGRDDVIVSSFNLASIDALVETAPTIPTGWLIGPGLAPIDACRTAAEHGHRALHPHVSILTPDVVADCARHAAGFGLEVNVWTVNEPVIAQVLDEHGYHSVITDDVVRLRSALR